MCSNTSPGRRSTVRASESAKALLTYVGGFHIETVPIQYTVGGGGRAAERNELIIFSWDDAAQPVGLF